MLNRVYRVSGMVFFNFSNKNFAVDNGILTGIRICLHGGPGGVRGSENTLTEYMNGP